MDSLVKYLLNLARNDFKQNRIERPNVLQKITSFFKGSQPTKFLFGLIEINNQWFYVHNELKNSIGHNNLKEKLLFIEVK